MGLNQRISKIIEYSQLTASDFADEIDVQRSSISHITSGRNKPSLDFITKIKDRFPEIEWDWLINGKGEMITPPQSNEKINPPTDEVEDTSPTPLPDLFNLPTNSEFSEKASEIKNDNQEHNENHIDDSQRLEKMVEIEEKNQSLQAVQHKTKSGIKRVVLFFEDGTFESYEH